VTKVKMEMHSGTGKPGYDGWDDGMMGPTCYTGWMGWMEWMLVTKTAKCHWQQGSVASMSHECFVLTANAKLISFCKSPPSVPKVTIA